MSRNRLPDPKGFRNFKPTAPVIVYDTEKKEIAKSIEYFESRLPKNMALRTVNNKGILYFHLSRLLGDGFLGGMRKYAEVLKEIQTDQIKISEYLGLYEILEGLQSFSSLVIKLYDENKTLKSLAIRHYRTPRGEIVKWYKLKGSDARFIPYRLRDEYSHCFVAFGMAEALIFNLLGVDYFILQSDSVAYHISNNPYFKTVKEKLKERDIIILPDYDESGLKASQALHSTLKGFSYPRIVEFYKLVDNPPKGFDFRDYILQIQNKDLILENLLKLI